jgi:hypothetical protein
MPRTPPPEGQVTLSDAVKHLHDRGLQVSEGMIYKWVAAGRLKRYGPESRKQKFYMLSELNQIVEEELTGARRPKPAPVVFDIIRREDLPACLRLDQIVYPEELDLGELATYQSWRQKNRHISIAAYDASNRDNMLAYLALVPLPEHIILDILKGIRPDHSVTADEVEAYDRSGGYTLLALSAVCHPDRPDLLLKILNHIMDFWIDEQYPTRYITRIYAQAVTDRGNMLISHFYMTPRYDLASNAYMLDLARPGTARMIRKFQERLQEKAPLPEELRHPYIPPLPTAVAQLEAERVYMRQYKPGQWRKNASSTFERATEADMPAIIEIDRRIFGAPAAELERSLQWLRKNPDTFYVLRNESGVITGYGSLLPLEREVIDLFVRDQIDGESITPDKIPEYTPGGGPYDLYAMSIGIDPAYGTKEKHEYGARLVAGLFAFLLNLAERGIEVATITARSYKPDGMRLLRKMGFPQLRSLVPHKNLFAVNIAESGFPLFVRYNELLAEWKQEHQRIEE